MEIRSVQREGERTHPLKLDNRVVVGQLRRRVQQSPEVTRAPVLSSLEERASFFRLRVDVDVRFAIHGNLTSFLVGKLDVKVVLEPLHVVIAQTIQLNDSRAVQTLAVHDLHGVLSLVAQFLQKGTHELDYDVDAIRQQCSRFG